MLKQSTIDLIILGAPLLLIAGVACYLAGLLLTGIYLAGFGVLAALVANWRTQPRC